MNQPYTHEFYELLQEGSAESAKRIVPLVLEVIGCDSVVDIGCGVGAWLSVFEEFGVSHILGVDGDYVDRESLHISPNQFVPFNISKGFKSDRRFELVVSLEVAEHISEENAETYLDSLVSLGPVVLFSASVPFQEGQDHVNEQWPDYWVSRFAQRGFVALDFIRPRIWQDPKVEWWYAQNIMLFVQQDQIELYPALKKLSEAGYDHPMALVHPRFFLYKQDKLNKLESENKYLKKRIEHLSSPLYMLSNLPRLASRKLASVVTRLRTETR